MKLVAIHTIRRGAYSTALKASRRQQLAPGDEFEAGETEAAELIEAGAARRKTREVIDDDAERPARRSLKRSRKPVSSGIPPVGAGVPDESEDPDETGDDPDVVDDGEGEYEDDYPDAAGD